jgi:GWxTD domain-containing protein
MKVHRSVRTFWFVTLTTTFLFTGRLVAQVESAESQSVGPPALFVDGISVAGAKQGESRLDVFVQMNYEGLSFVKNADRYDAAYEVTITILDSTGSIVSEKNWVEEVKNVAFDQSVSPSTFSIVQRVFPISPGGYRLIVTTHDNESKVTRKVERQVSVHDYSKHPFMLSDILLLNRVLQKGERRSIVPHVSYNIGNIPSPLHLFFEAYNTLKLDSVRYVQSVIDAKGDTVLQQDTVVSLGPGRDDQIIRLNTSQLFIGDFRLLIRAFRVGVPDSANRLLAGVTRGFGVRWGGIPRTVKDLDLAIEQIRYIAKEGELSLMMEAKTPEEKQEKFLEFWKRRDPNPNTPRNEKMELYYARVDYANRHFSHYREGWRTDMGMVYIIFGPPNDVERHPFEVDSKPYEVWRYYDLNQEFYFVDESGFSDYRLLNPLYDIRKRPTDW